MGARYTAHTDSFEDSWDRTASIERAEACHNLAERIEVEVRCRFAVMIWYSDCDSAQAEERTDRHNGRIVWHLRLLLLLRRLLLNLKVLDIGSLEDNESVLRSQDSARFAREKLRTRKLDSKVQFPVKGLLYALLCPLT